MMRKRGAHSLVLVPLRNVRLPMIRKGRTTECPPRCKACGRLGVDSGGIALPRGPNPHHPRVQTGAGQLGRAPRLAWALALDPRCKHARPRRKRRTPHVSWGQPHFDKFLTISALGKTAVTSSHLSREGRSAMLHAERTYSK